MCEVVIYNCYCGQQLYKLTREICDTAPTYCGMLYAPCKHDRICHIRDIGFFCDSTECRNAEEETKTLAQPAKAPRAHEKAKAAKREKRQRSPSPPPLAGYTKHLGKKENTPGHGA